MRKLSQGAARLFNLSNCCLCLDPLTRISAHPISASDWGSVEAESQAHPIEGIRFSEDGHPGMPILVQKANQAQSTKEYDLLLSAPYFRKRFKKTRDHLALTSPKGPVFSKVAWASTAAPAIFCYLSNHTSGTPVGNLDPARCNHIIWLRPGRMLSTTGEKSSVIFVTLPSAWILGTNTTQKDSTSTYCAGRPNGYVCGSDWFLLNATFTPGSCLKLWPDKTGNETVYWDHYRGYLWAEKGYGPVSNGMTNNPCLNPSMGLILSQSRFLSNETTTYFYRGSRNSIRPFPGSLTFSLTLPSSLGMFFLCGTSLYQTLPPQWTGLCTIVRVVPDLRYIPGSTPIPMPLQDLIIADPNSPAKPLRFRRAIQFLPLIIGGSILATTGVGIVGLAATNEVYKDLSHEIADLIDNLTQVVGDLQTELGSLAGVVLQNRRALNALLAAQGGVCVFLGEECCFYVNKSQQIQDSIDVFRSHATQLRKRAEAPQWYDMFSSLSPRVGGLLRSILLSAAGVLAILVLIFPGIRIGLALDHKCSTTLVNKIMLTKIIFPQPTPDAQNSASPCSIKEEFLELPFPFPEEM
ncbi:syncytin-2-like [Notamacropus eugenii]|uniref:syncytin-2-like n=1 Tax=Notamacropus eugenii TaxID=9315 RepID=UPI003B6724FE